MNRIPALSRLMGRALLFDGDAYDLLLARPQPLRAGLGMLIALGAGLGLSTLARSLLFWASTPEPAAVLGVWARVLGTLPLWQRLDPGGEWLQRLAGSLPSWQPLWQALRPAPNWAVAWLPLAPVLVLLGWLANGLLSCAVARRLGGSGELASTLACLALAEAPLLLLALPLLPPLGLAYLGFVAWVLAARFQALRRTQGLDGWRSFWAAVVPSALVAVLAGGVLLGTGLLVAARAVP